MKSRIFPIIILVFLLPFTFGHVTHAASSSFSIQTASWNGATINGGTCSLPLPGFTLTWTSITGASTYRVYSTNDRITYTLAATVSSPTLISPTLAAGSILADKEFSISAYDPSGILLSKSLNYVVASQGGVDNLCTLTPYVYLNSSGATAFTYSLSNGGNKTVVAGSSVTNTVTTTFTSVSKLYLHPFVSFTVSNPNSISVAPLSFNSPDIVVSSVPMSAVNTITINTTSATLPGTYTVTANAAVPLVTASCDEDAPADYWNYIHPVSCMDNYGNFFTAQYTSASWVLHSGVTAFNPSAAVCNNTGYTVTSSGTGVATITCNTYLQVSPQSTSFTVTITQPSTFNYSLSATNIASLQQGANGVSTVVATLAPSGTVSAIYSGSCVTEQQEGPPILILKICTSNSPYVSDISGGLAQLSTFADSVCGSGNWTQSGASFTCINPVTHTGTTNTAQPVNLTLTKILDVNGVNVLGKTDSTGIKFVSLAPSTVTPTTGSVSSILTIQADSKVPVGTYTGTVVSNTVDNNPTNMRSASFTINVISGAPPTLTATPGTCPNPNNVALSWTAPANTTNLFGYNIYRSDMASSPMSVLSSPRTYATTTSGAGNYTYGVSAVYWVWQNNAWVLHESASTTASATVLACPVVYTCGGTAPTGTQTMCGDNSANSISDAWHQVTSCSNPPVKCEYTAGGGSITGTCTATPSNPVNSGTLVTFQANPTSGTGPYSYNWNNSGYVLTNNSSVTYTNSGSAPISDPGPTVVIKDSNNAVTPTIPCPSVTVNGTTQPTDITLEGHYVSGEAYDASKLAQRQSIKIKVGQKVYLSWASGLSVNDYLCYGVVADQAVLAPIWTAQDKNPNSQTSGFPTVFSSSGTYKLSLDCNPKVVSSGLQLKHSNQITVEVRRSSIKEI